MNGYEAYPNLSISVNIPLLPEEHRFTKAVREYFEHKYSILDYNITAAPNALKLGIGQNSRVITSISSGAYFSSVSPCTTVGFQTSRL